MVLYLFPFSYGIICPTYLFVYLWFSMEKWLMEVKCSYVDYFFFFYCCLFNIFMGFPLWKNNMTMLSFACLLYLFLIQSFIAHGVKFSFSALGMQQIFFFFWRSKKKKSYKKKKSVTWVYRKYTSGTKYKLSAVKKSMKPWIGMKYLFAYHTFIFWVEVFISVIM